jgi:acetyl-CoA carboxylase biotin carboxylase subunit
LLSIYFSGENFFCPLKGLNLKKRVLISNRGEIAIRVANAVRELGLLAVGFWTDNEPNAMHLSFCDEWIKLAGKSNSETYLNIDQIIKLAKENKIDAIHPGYGFLSENEKFAKAVVNAGMIFIGPNSNAIRMMGDKAKSKELAKKANVPVVPGSLAEVENIEEAKKWANEIGFPVLLKAVAGGGGKGMRICESHEDIEKYFSSVHREALKSFGNGGLLVEKFIVNPHHIEVQVLADKFGNTFHLFERECSMQRRHQKIIEEAPSPFIGEDESLRSQLCETAVNLAKAVNYDSAGTVEFIMGEDRKFYFLEMNTRIQVEHGITEEITGIDLVAEMIQVAFGEKLKFSHQNEIKRLGCSIQSRICAEDPLTFLPSPGVVRGFDFVLSRGLRFDHCLYKGLIVGGEFDPMVGKLMSYGLTRNIAIRKLKYALGELHIEGLKTNRNLHLRVLDTEEFKSGNYNTKFLESWIQKKEQVDFFTEKLNAEYFLPYIAKIEWEQNSEILY